jgi:hypothetical protein
VLLQTDARVQGTRLNFQGLLEDALKDVTQHDEPEVAVEDLPRWLVERRMQHASEERLPIQSQRVQRLPGRQAARVGRQVEEGRVAEIGPRLSHATSGTSSRTWDCGSRRPAAMASSTSGVVHSTFVSDARSYQVSGVTAAPSASIRPKHARRSSARSPTAAAAPETGPHAIARSTGANAESMGWAQDGIDPSAMR